MNAEIVRPPRVVKTQRQTETAGPGSRKVVDATGLYLIVGKPSPDKASSRSWVFRYPRLDDPAKTRDMGLGSLADVSLADAKEKARLARNLRLDGKDPIAERDRDRADNAKKPTSFAEMLDRFIKTRAPSWWHRRASQNFRGSIDAYALPVIGHMALDNITINHVLAAMTAAEQEVAAKASNQKRSRNGKTTAQRLRQKIAQVIDLATALGFRSPTLPNPAASGPIRQAKPMKQKGERRHFRRIELEHAPQAFQALMAKLEENPSTALSAYALMIACALRPGEALYLVWPNIDLDKRLITLEPTQTKSQRRHVAPLSELAMDILARQAKLRRNECVFPAARRARDGATDRAFSHNAFAEAPKRGGIAVELGSPHSWRSIFRDWCGDIGRVDRDLAETALAHSLGAVEAAYRRQTAIEQRRPIMQAYADWLMGKSSTDAAPAREQTIAPMNAMLAMFACGAQGAALANDNTPKRESA